MSLLSLSLVSNRTTISQAQSAHAQTPAFDGVEIPAGGAINQLRALNALGASESTILLALTDQSNKDWIDHHLREQLNANKFTLLPYLDHIPYEQSLLSSDNHFLQHSNSGVPSLINAGAQDQFIEALNAGLRSSSVAVLSGDIPLGLEESFCARIANTANRSCKYFAIDADALALHAALTESPFLVSIDRERLLRLNSIEHVGDLPLSSYVDFCQNLIKAGAQNVAAALSHDQFLLVSKDGFALLSAPKIEKVSPIGNGDTWLAVTMNKIAFEGRCLEDAAIFGSGATVAQQLNPIPGQFNLEDATLLSGRISVLGHRFGQGITKPELLNPDNWREVRILMRPNQDTRFNNSLLQTSSKPREDYFSISNNCIVIADGITHRAISGKYLGRSTSAEAANLVCRIVPKVLELDQHKDIETSLRVGLKTCNTAIKQINAHRSAAEVSASDLGGAVATVVARAGDTLHLMHIGDCCAFLVGPENVKRLTAHQTATAETIAQRWKTEGVPKDEISKRKRSLRNPKEPCEGAFGVLTGEAQALDYVEYSKVKIGSATHLIVCSDGFSALSDQQLISIAYDNADISEIVKKLERSELQNSVRSDDKTIIIAEL